MAGFPLSVDKNNPLPLYYQLRSALLERMQDGTYPVGTSIPTEGEMQRELEISRSTIRQAISELVQEGWLVRKTSKGTFVAEPKAAASHVRAFEPFYQQIARVNKVPRTELVYLRVEYANAMLAQEMKLGEGEQVISMFRRRYADQTPMVTIQNFLPYRLCSSILSHDFKRESLYEVMRQNDLSCVAETTTIVSAAKATAEDVANLEIKLNCPVLCFHTISCNGDGEIVDFAYSHYRGDLNRFEINAKPEKQGI